MLSFKVENLYKAYSKNILFENFNAEFAPGTFTSIVGSSGCGKSTFLKMLAGLETPDAGKILKSKDESTGLVFQEPRLLPWRTVRENISLPTEIRGSLNSSEIERALERVGLSPAAELFPHQLSGGMKMRVSLARALVLLMSSLDNQH